MGRSGDFVAVRSTDVPADMDEFPEWAEGTGARDGWAVFLADPVRIRPPFWSRAGIPFLTASVYDSDVVEIRWNTGSWVKGEQFDVSLTGGTPIGRLTPPTPEERAQAVASLREWIGEPADPDRIDAALAARYTYAEDELFALLAALGVLADGATIEPKRPVVPGFLARMRWAEGDPPRGAVVDGDDRFAGAARGLPERPRVVYLAAAIDHAGPGWARFVGERELDRWGEPGCLIAESATRVPTGQLAQHSRWHLYLGTDPMISLYSPSGGYLWQDPLPHGAWHVVPSEHAGPAAALAWATEHVATTRVAAGPGHEPRLIDLAEPPDHPYRGAPAYDWQRVREPMSKSSVSVYTNLRERLDEVVTWLTEARRRFLDPAAEACTARHGCAFRLSVVDRRGRRDVVLDSPEAVAEQLDRFAAGRLLALEMGVLPHNRRGHRAEFWSGISVGVKLLPAGRAAVFRIDGGRQFLGGRLHDIRDLLRDTAVRFEAATAGITGPDGRAGRPEGLPPPDRSVPLSSQLRFLRWGTLFGPAHLAAIGGAGRLHELLAAGRINRLEQWSATSWWTELTPDPFDRYDAQPLADDLPGLWRPR